MKYSNTSGRYALLDELRGLDLVSMMLYHGCWDLVNLFGIQADLQCRRESTLPRTETATAEGQNNP